MGSNGWSTPPPGQPLGMGSLWNRSKRNTGVFPRNAVSVEFLLVHRVSLIEEPPILPDSATVVSLTGRAVGGTLKLGRFASAFGTTPIPDAEEGAFPLD